MHNNSPKNSFYKLQFALKSNEIYLESLDKIKSEELFKEENFNEPLRVRISEGKKLYDIVRFQDPFNFAISEKVLNLLIEKEITGWSHYEIDIVGREEKYFGFQVQGKSGSIKRPFKTGFVIGLKFDEDTWDGQDFFNPNDTYSIFCTKRVKDIFSNNRISNIELKSIDTFEWYNAG